jgi:transcriptional regulator with PAS, ATPase and Fis domain
MIHEASLRKDGPYVKVNCAAIPDNLLESELFGYAGGAFTGAKREGKPGKFELAQNGTIFLDEIGDMDMNMQVQLLRVLQEKELERVGGTKPIKLNIRVVAATNRNLEELIKEGKFRQDLYYRLNVIEVKIPPLRERREDIPILTRHFVKELAGEDVHISPRTTRILNTYDWPGNVRELQNVLEHACIMRNEEKLIETSSLPEYLRPRECSKPKKEEVSNYNIREMVCELERELIQEAVNKFPNKTKAIEELGISRRSFYEKIKKYGIEVEEDAE